MNINYFMNEAIKEANYAYDNKEVPVGGVLAVSYTHLTLPTSDLV